MFVARFGWRIIVCGLQCFEVFARHAPADQAGDGQDYGVEALKGIGGAFTLLSTGRAVVIRRSSRTGRFPVTGHRPPLPLAAT
ncbi:MAG: hypothetical protein KDH19_00750 [Geminicoccaceae bacterium]|nr:hypothetical protein [Geminicoccaceae bacterium]